MNPLEHLAAQFSYNPVTGALKRGNHLIRSHKPYPSVTFGGMTIPIHRLIWALYHGKFPPSNMIVDHINRNPFDNRADNLRLVSQEENARNNRRSLAKAIRRANGEPVQILTVEEL